MSDAAQSGQEGAADLIETVRSGVSEGEIPLRIFNDERVHRTELERVFGRAWVFVGHETELTEPGDYARRFVGNDPFIFVRDEDGEINVLFDSCRHRGTQICRADQGNTSHFRCPYHGWTYKTNGDLVGVPNRTDAYEGLDTSEHGLVSAPRIDTYGGMVFASLDPDAPPLEAYLGDLTWYLDMTFGLTPGGMEVLGDPQRHILSQNWKPGAENSAGDGYHTQTTHKSAIEAGFVEQEWTWEGSNRYYEYVHDIPAATDRLRGHSMLIGQVELEEGDAFMGYPEEVQANIDRDALSDEQYDVVRKSTVQVTTLFPNLTIMHQNGSRGHGEPQTGYLYLRKWRPVAPDRTESWIWFLAPAEASDEYKKRAYNAGMATFGATGSFDQDDTAVWEGISTAAGSTITKREDLTLNYEMGLDGVTDVEADDAWPGPGRASRDMNEGYARGFYGNWAQLLEGA